MNTFKGYVLTILCGIVVVAAVVLVALQWGSTAKFSLYGPEKSVPTVWLVLASAVGGWVFPHVARMFLRGAGIVRQSRKDKAARQA